MQHVVIVIHLMLVLALIGVVLLQKSEGGGLGIGSTGGFMTSRGTANVLTRATAILAGLFFATSLILSILAGIEPQADLDPAAAARARRPRPPAPTRRCDPDGDPQSTARRAGGAAGRARGARRAAGAAVEIEN